MRRGARTPPWGAGQWKVSAHPRAELSSAASPGAKALEGGRVEGGGQRMESEAWMMGGWEMEDEWWRMEDGKWRVEDGRWRAEDRG